MGEGEPGDTAASANREYDPVKGRNKVRDMATGALNTVALTILVLGFLRPLLDDDVPFALTTSLGAGAVSIVLWAVAAYVHMRTEKE